MPTTYGIKELSVILDIEIKARPLHAFFELFVDHCGALIIGYAIDSDGFWLQIHKECITEKRLIESWTGYDIFDCCHKKIEGYEGHLYGLLPNCSPMLPAIFTAQQFSDFLMHTTIIRNMLDRGDETQVWLDDLAVSNPKAAELANLVLYGVMPPESEANSSSRKIGDERPNSIDWKALAKTRALAIIKEHKLRDTYPSQEIVADTIANEFRNAFPQVVGSDGKPLTGASIKRHALKGITSAQGKQLSMKTLQGK